ncbi:hypothetical protein [Thermoflexus sp.]|uniref:hypothetical protein n=1 Tax=Thermoflexus sp. TaxID=1969742 RepID=UPI0025ED007B|nr:hypothetical protein [Thermoflexus sp.]MCS6963355.1 hypothetical protein [Thermoflexus sp.]MCX7691634.1 hypothetical protein [Thermoflexus sp.]MDW8185471.1 hypothetical protein [Anaerolineae bacterium]
MAEPIRLFVTSSPELEAEREVAGQVVAGLPVRLGWEIRHTPRPGEALAPALAAVETAHLYVFILGMDYSAPMGLEWAQAVRAKKRKLVFVKEVAHSPAAALWISEHSEEVDWVSFDSLASFRLSFERHLIRALLDLAEALRLHLDEIEGLRARLKALEEAVPEAPTVAHGAERSAIILGER